MATQKHGFVALFDVLGFSDRVSRGAIEGLDSYINTVSRITRTYERLGTILFSDTVVFYTFDDGQDAFDSILSVSCAVLYDLIDASVPVRGAISYGPFVRSEHAEHGTVIAGRPIIEAHHYESRSQWIGVMLAPSVLERRPDLTAGSCSLSEAATKDNPRDRCQSALVNLMVQPCKSIPLEDETGTVTDFEGFAMVPVLGRAKTVKDLRDGLDGSRQKLERMKQLAPEVRSQAKYQRSIEWVQHVRRQLADAFGHRIDE